MTKKQTEKLNRLVNAATDRNNNYALRAGFALLALPDLLAERERLQKAYGDYKKVVAEWWKGEAEWQKIDADRQNKVLKKIRPKVKP